MVLASFARNALQMQRPVARRAIAAVATPNTAASVASQSTTAARGAFVRPAHVQNDVTGIVAGVALVGALIGAGKMWYDASSSCNPAKKYASLEREIAREEVVKFFQDLIENVKMLFSHIPNLEKELRAELSKQNITLTDDEFRQTLQEQLYQVMNQIEVQLVGDRGWTPQRMEQAFIKHDGDEQVKALQGELRELMQTVFPQQNIEIPDDLTEEKVLQILEMLVDGMELAMKETLAHARSEGITDATKALEEFQSIYLEHVETFSNKQMQAFGITSQIFTAALQKYHMESDAFKKKVEAIYAKQAASFRKMGLEVHDS